MTEKTINGVLLSDILNPVPMDETKVERIEGRADRKSTIDVISYDPKWPEYYTTFATRIRNAFTDPALPSPPTPKPVTILSMAHVGSTSVPGLSAKPVIDIDLVLSDNSVPAEAYYVPRFKAAGFDFRLREPGWHEHRFFCLWDDPIQCNLHVWDPKCPEVERHRIFGDWLRRHDDDRDRYGKVKEESAVATKVAGEGVMGYNTRKEWVIREILLKAFAELEEGK